LSTETPTGGVKLVITAAGFLTPVPVSTPKMLKPKIVPLIKKLKGLLAGY
jgi:hypothetical protein